MARKDNSIGARTHGAFKQVRNKLRKYYPEEVVWACIDCLNGPESGSIEHLRHFPPWLLLLLVKWTLLHGDHISRQLRHLLKRDFVSLANLLHDFAGATRTPSEYDNYFLFLRNTAFQQFWLYRQNAYARLARQGLLFGHLQNDHPFSREFRDEVGLSIEAFVELAWMLISRFVLKRERFVTERWFDPVRKAYPPSSIRRFLDTLSLDFGSLRQYLEGAQENKHSLLYEFFEHSPLKRYPLLRRDDRYYCFSPSLLLLALETFVSDTLRSHDPRWFMNKYGLMFETYVKEAISYSGAQFVSEETLQHQLGKQGKTVDFLLVEDNCNILVDAKGVEMGYLGMFSHNPNVVRDKTKSSVLKAIRQAYETASRIASVETVGGLPIGKGSNFLLVITFKNLYLGNGQDFHDFVAREAINRAVEKCGGEELIPLRHMYFLSIDELDHFVECRKSTNRSFAKVLETAVQADRCQSTKKLVFAQHLSDECPERTVPAYLDSEIDELSNRVARRFGRGKG